MRSKILQFTFQVLVVSAMLGSTISTAFAQEAASGIVMPITLTGGILVTQRVRDAEPESGEVFPGIRAVLYPSLKINSSWFVSSTVQVQSAPFFFYEAFYPEREIKTEVQQLFIGYTHTGERSSLGIKAGQLNSAFGAFPLRYSDAVNPLLDQPFAYAYPVKLRPDQLPCGTRDLAAQVAYPIYVEHYCGGATAERNGMTPVTLYGLPGVELSASWHRMDVRFQLTNSSPSNPQSLQSHSQHAQFTTGVGFTIQQGFRVGISGFDGPFLENDVLYRLSSDTTVRDFPARGMGAEIQWGSGRWSANAEWHRVAFHYPRFTVPPSVSAGYVEIKSILTPRFYAAVRGGGQEFGRVLDIAGNTANHFLPNRQSYEAALGFHVNHLQTVKVGYEWLKTNGKSGTRNNVFGVQLVTSVNSLSKAF
jgi:hypothetical protein